MIDSKIIWPKIFENPDMEYHLDLDDEKRKMVAVSDILCGWGNVYCGSKPPKGFGVALLKLSEISGCPASMEGAMEFSHKQLQDLEG